MNLRPYWCLSISLEQVVKQNGKCTLRSRSLSLLFSLHVHLLVSVFLSVCRCLSVTYAERLKSIHFDSGLIRSECAYFPMALH